MKSLVRAIVFSVIDIRLSETRSLRIFAGNIIDRLGNVGSEIYVEKEWMRVFYCHCDTYVVGNLQVIDYVLFNLHLVLFVFCFSLLIFIAMKINITHPELEISQKTTLFGNL